MNYNNIEKSGHRKEKLFGKYMKTHDFTFRS